MDSYIIDGFLKVAQEGMDEDARSVLTNYLVTLRALYLLHQQNHWDAKLYGDHLLYQRIYEGVQEMADEAAERAIGLCGEIEFDGKESEVAKEFAPEEKSARGLAESSLKAEEAFQDIAKETYDKLTDKDMMTLGLDDMIMGHASQSEVHMYLLKQIIKGHE